MYAQSSKKTQSTGPLPDVVNKRLDKLELSLGTIEKVEKDLRSVTNTSNDLREQSVKMKTQLEDSIKTSEERIGKDLRTKLTTVERDINKAVADANNSKTTVDDLSRRVDRLRKKIFVSFKS